MSTHLDRKEIQRRLLLRLLGHPLTVLPAVGGLAAIASPFLFGLDPAMPIFAGITSLVVGGATLAIRTITGRDAISRDVLSSLERDAAAEYEGRLDALGARLVDDEDPGTQALLADLRELVRAVEQDAQWRDRVSLPVAEDILEGIDELFEGSVDALRRSVDLYETARRIQTRDARVALQGERERLVAEVEDSVRSLSRLVTDLRVLGTESAGEGADLEQVRRSLHTILAEARASADETRSWTSSRAAVHQARKKKEGQ